MYPDAVIEVFGGLSYHSAPTLAGRITADDIKRVAGGGAAPAAPAAASAPASGSAPAAQAAEPVADTTVADLKGQTIPFNAMQMAVSKNMLASLAVRLLCPALCLDSIRPDIWPRGDCKLGLSLRQDLDLPFLR